jgi:amidohydrolase
MPTIIDSDRIRALSQELFPELVAIRRYLHAHPELSFEEAETGSYIAGLLRAKGIACTTGWGGHGVVALVEGARPGRVIALRADIDALPIQEATDRPYRSLKDGVMHACGHDAHTASLLGTAFILYDLRERWAGTVKFIFQPGEEKFPGGASLLIAEGVLRDPGPSAIFGQHVLPELDAGKVGFREGMSMASADEIYLTVEGRGGHGAQPHLLVDPVAIAATLVTSLQQLVSRNADPLLPTVLTFGRIWSDGGATNVIPSRVHLEGTLRTLDEDWRQEAHRLLTRMAEGIAAGMGGHCRLEIRKGYPALHNDPSLTRRARASAEAYLGAENVVDIPIRMGAEDFAWYGRELPSCFYRLGTGTPGGPPAAGLHSPAFDIDEDALRTGSGLMARIALDALAGE